MHVNTVSHTLFFSALHAHYPLFLSIPLSFLFLTRMRPAALRRGVREKECFCLSNAASFFGVQHSRITSHCWTTKTQLCVYSFTWDPFWTGESAPRTIRAPLSISIRPWTQLQHPDVIPLLLTTAASSSMHTQSGPVRHLRAQSITCLRV